MSEAGDALARAWEHWPSDPAAAGEAAAQAQSLATPTGEGAVVAGARLCQGLVAYDGGDLRTAHDLFLGARRFYERDPDDNLVDLGAVDFNLGLVAAARGWPTQARRRFTTSRTWFERVGQAGDVADCESRLAGLDGTPTAAEEVTESTTETVLLLLAQAGLTPERHESGDVAFTVGDHEAYARITSGPDDALVGVVCLIDAGPADSTSVLDFVSHRSVRYTPMHLFATAAEPHQVGLASVTSGTRLCAGQLDWVIELLPFAARRLARELASLGDGGAP